MHYAKHFKLNGIDTRLTACIELQGKPNSATEGQVGVLGIDMSSPLHEVYKCVDVKGSIYTWELLSSGMSMISAKITGNGDTLKQFPYASLRIPDLYIVKVGDLILDKEGYLYWVIEVASTFCVAQYTETQVVAYGMSAYQLAVDRGFKGSEDEWLDSLRAKLTEADKAELVQAVMNGLPDGDEEEY